VGCALKTVPIDALKAECPLTSSSQAPSAALASKMQAFAGILGTGSNRLRNALTSDALNVACDYSRWLLAGVATGIAISTLHKNHCRLSHRRRACSVHRC
jgi:hypothetical protein